MYKFKNRLGIIAVLVTLLLAVAVSTSWAQGPTGVDPSTENLQGDVKVQTGNIGGSTFYGINLRASSTRSFFTSNTAAIEPVTVIVATSVNYYAGDFANNNFSVLYVLNDLNQLSTLNTTTGAVTLIGTATPSAGENWTGMTWDASNSTMYASGASGTVSTLYTINLTTGAATVVGSMGASTPLMIDIASNTAGQMYGVDISTDSLYSINKTTGAATLIGATGIAANFAQGMDFDDSTGTLYWASYSGGGVNSVVSLNLTTGASTAIGSFTDREVDAFAFAESAGGGPTPTATATTTGPTPTASPTPGQGGTYCSTAPLTIPDNLPSGATSVVTVPDSGTISDLNVLLDVTHSWVGDLTFTLSHGATTAELYDRPGVPASTFGCSGANFVATADDEGATSFEAACQNATPAFPVGNYIPGDPAGPNLAAFDGQNINGAWTLTASDSAAGDTGVLNQWCLVPTIGGGGPTATPTVSPTPGGNVPDINVSPASVSETHNNPPQTTNQNLTIGNTGGATLEWTITEETGALVQGKGDAYVPSVVGNAPAAQGNNSLSTGTGAGTYANDFVPSAGSTTVTHSSSQDIEAGNSVSCNAGGLHTDNSYYRVFDLAGDFGINDTFTVNEISFGVEQATGATGTQPVSVILYTLSGPFVLANLTEIGREDISVADTAGTIETVPFSPAVVVPTNGILVVEIFTPNGQTAGNSFFIGSNTAAQTDPSYLRAVDCGISQPTDTAAIGFPDMHIVINATGDVGGGGACTASDIPWLTVSPTNGSTAPGGSSNVTLTFNSTSLAPGTYTGNLCIESNDPDENPVDVPVSLTVNQPTAIDLGSLTQATGGIRVADFAAAGLLLLAGATLLLRRRK